MNKTTIEVGGKAYPCRLTMGAMLLYKRNTNEDVSRMKGDDLEAMLMFMWCCVVCACKADGVEFDMDFETFTCMVTPQDMSQWNAALGDGKKKDETEA